MNSRIRGGATRVFLSVMMLTALNAAHAEAQYFSQAPLDTWRSAMRLSSHTVAKVPGESVAPASPSADKLANMSTTSAVRVGCGISSVEALANFSIDFTKTIGLVWGSAIIFIGLLSLRRADKASLFRIGRGMAIVGFGLSVPLCANALISILRDHLAESFDLTSVVLCACAGLFAAMLAFIVVSSPERFRTMKRIALSIVATIGAAALVVGGLWASSMFAQSSGVSANATQPQVSDSTSVVIPTATVKVNRPAITVAPSVHSAAPVTAPVQTLH